MRAFLRKSGILVWVIAAIILATVLGSVRVGGDHLVPVEIGRIFATFSAVFSQFLSFSIPLIIIGLVTPAIADLGRGAGKWLGITTAIAYGSTLFSGFLTFLVCAALFPRLLASTQLASVAEPGSALESYFTIEMPAPLQVMTALLLSFVVGLGLSMVPRGVLRKGFIEFRAIITRLIETIIIPLLPLHIFGIFLNLTYTGEAASVIRTLLRVVVVVLVLEVVILLTQFCVAGAVARRNPIKALLTMMPAYLTALLLSFVVGLGLSMVPRGVLRKGFIEFRAIITRLIETIIIPLLPLHIFGIFLNLTYTGEAASVIRTLLRVVIVVLVLEVVILLTQFCFAGAVARRNPIKSLLTMMPAYLTALGTSSSAATIPVTLRQTKKNGVSDAVASFTIPLCATIHLAGSTSKIFAFAFAIVLTQGLTVSTLQWVGFIFMLGITMVAAPGVPGGAIMAATGLLSSMLGFDDAQVALMIATYIALDSFGTATNVTGDGAIALIIDRMAHGSIGNEGDPENARELAFDGMAYLDRVSVEGVVSPEELADSAARNGADATA